MTPFQLFALAGIGLWLAAVAIWFRRSTPVLMGGLALAAAGVIVAVYGLRVVMPDELGLTRDASWTHVVVFALGGLAATLAWSPAGDAVASRLVAAPPTLGAFRPLQRSWVHLAVGLVAAWALGGVLEEVVLRGVVEQAVEAAAAGWAPGPVAAGLGIGAAAGAAAILHLYQGPRAAIIIAQLSVLFGLVFVLSGHNLWAVILCHGLYDTIAFVRFAMGKSKYSRPAP